MITIGSLKSERAERRRLRHERFCAARTIQNIWRCNMAGYVVETARRKKASISVQRIWRGTKTRQPTTRRTSLTRRPGSQRAVVTRVPIEPLVEEVYEGVVVLETPMIVKFNSGQLVPINKSVLIKSMCSKITRYFTNHWYR